MITVETLISSNDREKNASFVKEPGKKREFCQTRKKLKFHQMSAENMNLIKGPQKTQISTKNRG